MKISGIALIIYFLAAILVVITLFWLNNFLFWLNGFQSSLLHEDTVESYAAFKIAAKGKIIIFSFGLLLSILSLMCFFKSVNKKQHIGIKLLYWSSVLYSILFIFLIIGYLFLPKRLF